MLDDFLCVDAGQLVTVELQELIVMNVVMLIVMVSA